MKQSGKMKVMAALLAGIMILGSGFSMKEASAMEQNHGKTETQKKAVKIVQTAGRDQLGDFAPDFARYNDDILFGEVWSKNDVLSLHDRSIVTVSALIAQGITDSSLKYHIGKAKKNSVTKAEMAEIITQVGFYGGWTKAWAAFRYAKEVYAE